MIGLRKIPGNNRHCVVLSSDIKEAFFVAQTLSSQHVCNRGGFFCLQISSPSRIMRARRLPMFARNVSIHLKSNTLPDYTRTFEKDILPLLRKQNGFKDEIAFAGPGGVDV